MIKSPVSDKTKDNTVSGLNLATNISRKIDLSPFMNKINTNSKSPNDFSNTEGSQINFDKNIDTIEE